MNRLDELESTPRKRTLKQDETTTKSGRKVKRPAHLDSPERAPSVSPSETRKSVAVTAKKAMVPSAGTPSKRTATKEQISPKEAKGSRKTITTTRKTITEHLDTPKENKEKKQLENIVDDTAGTSTSGRKIKIPTKLMEFESDVLSSPRKHVVEVQDVVVTDKLAKTRGRSKTPAKSVVKNIDAEQNQHPDDEEKKGIAVRKTPGRRAKSVVADQLEVDIPNRRGVSSLFNKETQKEMSTSEQAPSKTPGKRGGKALMDLNVKASPKTPGRRTKSFAPGKEETDDDLNPAKNVSHPSSKKATQTPARRVGKSMLNVAVQSSHSEIMDSVEAVPKTPGRKPIKAMIDTKASTLVVDSPRSQASAAKTPGRRQKSVAVEKTDSVAYVPSVGKTEITTAEEPLSRSGRKLKPKKVFDFEQEEKSTDPINTNATVSMESRMKMKKDDSEESTKSPIKKKNIENIGVQTPKLKSRLKPNISLLGTESPQMENPTDGTVSRSGRKIKPKKMFGFDDGVETMTTFVHITGSSPTLIEETVEANNRDDDISAMNAVQKNTRSPKINTSSTPTKPTTSLDGIVEQKSSAPRSANDQMTEELVDFCENDKQQTFISIRGKDDHHHVTAKAIQKQQYLIDETDRAIVSSEPMIIRTSIGFGKPKVQKQTLSEGTDELKGDDRRKVNENTTPSCVDTQAMGSSRSGRKIKPKKFFDTDDLTTTSRQSVITPKENQPVSVPRVLSPKQVVEDQKHEECHIPTAVDDVAGDEVMNPAEGMDIPEGPVKLVNETTFEVCSDDAVEQKQQEEVADTETTDHNDVAIEPVEDVPDMKNEEEIIDEGSITMKEDFAAQLEGKTDVSENQRMALEEENHIQLRNDNISNVTHSERLVSEHHDEDLALKESALDADVKQDLQTENSFVKYDLVHTLADHEERANISIDKMIDESNAAIETLRGVSSTSIADTKSDEVANVDSTGSVTTSNEKVDEEIPGEASFGSIEYLEDEMNNIVEHINKPSHHEPMEEDINVSASAIPSIVIVQDTPARIALNETFSPVKQNSSIIDITADTPCPVAPRTPDSKLTVQEENDKCSPDKPPEVIEIMDSPAVAAFCKQINDESAHGGDGGSATSTPLAVKASLLPVVNECEDSNPFESRKRSLSASAVDITMKRNVTFHSPANCTMLVETIDERLMLKSLQDQQQQRHETMETSSKSIGEKLRKPRKRSLSEHKPYEMKRNKTNKLPNFKSIHANHFNRMESIADFVRRKESRAKQIISSYSPATKLPSQPVTDASGVTGVPSVEKKIPSSSTKPFIFKSGGGGIPVPSAGLFVKRTKEGQIVAKSAGMADRPALPAIAAASTAKKPIASDTERMANRLKQFQTTFKPKQIGKDTSAVPMSSSLASTSTDVVGVRPVEQLRSKQSKILKGVRTNRRFELQMKHRDNLQHQ